MVLDCRYQLQELLGDGAFGRVLKARDLQEDRDVALKAQPSMLYTVGPLQEACPSHTMGHTDGHSMGLPGLPF